MKIPKREVVKFVVKSALHRKSAGSQEELVGMVNRELRKVDAEYSITGKRLRDVVSGMKEVRMTVNTRKGKKPGKCPSCNSVLTKKFDRNLKGRNVLSSLHCRRCGYRGHDGRWTPGRYTFSLRH
jgi:predicted Zn-ribbon and HTH transcriptional regulator